ncbi:hypothetical protein ABPG72_003807 [Tetrahymena utriculariae]
MAKCIKWLFFIGGLCSIVVLSAINIPSRMTLNHKFTELPSDNDLKIQYSMNSDDSNQDQFDTASSFFQYINYSCFSLIDFIIIVGIEFLKVLLFNKPLYLEVEGNNQIYNEEKVPSYVETKKKRHLLDEKEIPMVQLIVTLILIVKDMMILPLSLIAFKYDKITGLVQYGQLILHTLGSPQVFLSFQHLAYSRLGVIQDIAEDTEGEYKIDKTVSYIMHFMRCYILFVIIILCPLLVIGSIFGTIIVSIYSFAAFGLFIPGLLILYAFKKRGFSNRCFIPLLLIIFVGVGMVTLVSYITSIGILVSNSSSIKSIFQYYLGPNTFNIWYFASNKQQDSWKDKLYYVIRIIAVI